MDQRCYYLLFCFLGPLKTCNRKHQILMMRPSESYQISVFIFVCSPCSSSCPLTCHLKCVPVYNPLPEEKNTTATDKQDKDVVLHLVSSSSEEFNNNGEKKLAYRILRHFQVIACQLILKIEIF